MFLKNTVVFLFSGRILGARPLGGTGEDALLDLERAREESGVLRWALLSQILADMRARMAEMSSNISDFGYVSDVFFRFFSQFFSQFKVFF